MEKELQTELIEALKSVKESIPSSVDLYNIEKKLDRLIELQESNSGAYSDRSNGGTVDLYYIEQKLEKLLEIKEKELDNKSSSSVDNRGVEDKLDALIELQEKQISLTNKLLDAVEDIFKSLPVSDDVWRESWIYL
jgi:hypothetical protein